MPLIHSPFFDLFPKIDYDLKRENGSYPENVPNIFFRLGFMKDVISRTTSYDMYRLDDGDTPEIIAEKIYGDSGAGWMVLYANKIFDPQFDWPLDDQQFEAYIINKYGSIEIAQSTIHHIEKTVTIENVTDGETHISKYTIAPRRYTDNRPKVPFDYWVWKENLSIGPQESIQRITADTDLYRSDYDLLDITVDLDLVLTDGGLSRQSAEKRYNVNGDNFIEYSTGTPVTIYDYEEELNEKKKFIKVIKSAYYDTIMNEFRVLTGHYSTQFTRLM